MKNLFLSLAMLSLTALFFAGCTATEEGVTVDDAAMATEEVVEPAMDAVTPDAAMEAEVVTEEATK